MITVKVDVHSLTELLAVKLACRMLVLPQSEIVHIMDYDSPLQTIP